MELENWREGKGVAGGVLFEAERRRPGRSPGARSEGVAVCCGGVVGDGPDTDPRRRSAVGSGRIRAGSAGGLCVTGWQDVSSQRQGKLGRIIRKRQRAVAIILPANQFPCLVMLATLQRQCSFCQHSNPINLNASFGRFHCCHIGQMVFFTKDSCVCRRFIKV